MNKGALNHILSFKGRASSSSYKSIFMSEFPSTTYVYRQRSRATRQTADLLQPWNTAEIDNTTLIRSNVSDSSQFNRVHRRSPGAISEIIILEHNPLLDGRLEGSDRFGAWRINADIMSYEELVELSDRIGYVGGSLTLIPKSKTPNVAYVKAVERLDSHEGKMVKTTRHEQQEGCD